MEEKDKNKESIWIKKIYKKVKSLESETIQMNQEICGISGFVLAMIIISVAIFFLIMIESYKLKNSIEDTRDFRYESNRAISLYDKKGSLIKEYKISNIQYTGTKIEINSKDGEKLIIFNTKELIK